MTDYIFFIGGLTGICCAILTDWWMMRKYNYPSLSILIAFCHNSKRFGWLTFNLWGNDSRFYKKVAEAGELKPNKQETP